MKAKLLKEFKTVQVGDTHIIKSPGKFQSEPIFVPYFYDKVLDGGADEEYWLPQEERMYDVFFPNDEDKAEFPELRNTLAIILYETDTGFVNSEVYTDNASLKPVLEELRELEEQGYEAEC